MKVRLVQATCVLAACGSIAACMRLPVTATIPAASSEAQTTVWRGQLLRMGSEPGSWLALRDDTGKIWRLEKMTPEAFQQLILYQHRRIRVSGIQGENWLATPVIEVRQWWDDN